MISPVKYLTPPSTHIPYFFQPSSTSSTAAGSDNPRPTSHVSFLFFALFFFQFMLYIILIGLFRHLTTSQHGRLSPSHSATFFFSTTIFLDLFFFDYFCNLSLSTFVICHVLFRIIFTHFFVLLCFFVRQLYIRHHLLRQRLLRQDSN